MPIGFAFNNKADSTRYSLTLNGPFTLNKDGAFVGDFHDRRSNGVIGTTPITAEVTLHGLIGVTFLESTLDGGPTKVRSSGKILEPGDFGTSRLLKAFLVRQQQRFADVYDSFQYCKSLGETRRA